VTTPRHFASFTEARNQFRSVLDAARAGLVTTVVRDKERFVVVAADHLRDELARLRPSQALVAAEGGGWSVMLPGLPVHGDGETFDDAIADTIVALREYAEDWNARLHAALNHRGHRSVVELVELSTDEQLREWLLGHADGAEHGSRRLVNA
jgi:predicted RNase H-like HicB family nuclease